MKFARVLSILLMLGLSIGLLHSWTHAGAPMSGSGAYLVAIIALVLLIVLVTPIPRQFAVITIAAVLVVAGYAYRPELEAVLQNALGIVMPYRGEEVGKGSISFHAWPDGQFRIEAMVNGTPVVFLVDTGAGTVVLTPEDAARVGYDPQSLYYSDDFSTANGDVLGAPVALDEIDVGPIRVRDVPAVVNGASMPTSLLGMTFLEGLDAFDVKGGVLTLTQDGGS